MSRRAPRGVVIGPEPKQRASELVAVNDRPIERPEDTGRVEARVLEAGTSARSAGSIGCPGSLGSTELVVEEGEDSLDHLRRLIRVSEVEDVLCTRELHIHDA